MIKTGGQTVSGVFKQEPQAIRKQVEAWRTACPDALFVLAIETSKGALINALLEYDDIRIYPINPNALASYRKAFAHGGGKNDIVDARLLAQFLLLHREKLRPLQRDSQLTRQLVTLAEDRHRLV
ncbi:MAG: transposase, partial [Planctomycetota bacterium]